MPPIDSLTSDDSDAADELAQVLAERRQRRLMAQAMQDQGGSNQLGSLLSNLAVGLGAAAQGQDASAAVRQNMAAMSSQAANRAKLAALDDSSDIKGLSALANIRAKTTGLDKKYDSAIQIADKKGQYGLEAAKARAGATTDAADIRGQYGVDIANIQAENRKQINELTQQIKQALQDKAIASKEGISDADREYKYRQLDQRMQELEKRLGVQKAIADNANASRESIATQGNQTKKDISGATIDSKEGMQQTDIDAKAARQKADLAAKQAAAKFKATQPGGGRGGMASTADDRLASMAADKIHKDKNITALTSSKQLVDRAVQILNRPGITNEEFNDAQIDITNASAGGGSAAMGKLERTEYNTLGQRFARLQQEVTGEPTDAVPPGILARAKSLAAEMSEMVAKNRYERAQALRRTYGSVRAQKNQDDAIETYRYEPKKAPGSDLYGPPAPNTTINAGGLDIDVSKMSREQKLKLLRGQ